MCHANEQLFMLAEICMRQGGGFFATAAMNALTTYHPASMGPVVLGPSSANSVSSMHDKERAAEDQGAGSRRLAENQQGKSQRARQSAGKCPRAPRSRRGTAAGIAAGLITASGAATTCTGGFTARWTKRGRSAAAARWRALHATATAGSHCHRVGIKIFLVGGRVAKIFFCCLFLFFPLAAVA